MASYGHAAMFTILYLVVARWRSFWALFLERVFHPSSNGWSLLVMRPCLDYSTFLVPEGVLKEIFKGQIIQLLGCC